MNSVSVTLSGNVISEVVAFGGTDTKGLRFRVAVNPRRRDRNGNWVEGNSYFVDVKCWGRLAENAYRSLHKGDPVVIVGRPETTDYVNGDGQRRISHEIIANLVGHDLTFGTAGFSRNARVGQPEQPPQSATVTTPSQAAAADPWPSGARTGDAGTGADEPDFGPSGEAGGFGDDPAADDRATDDRAADDGAGSAGDRERYSVFSG